MNGQTDTYRSTDKNEVQKKIHTHIHTHTCRENNGSLKSPCAKVLISRTWEDDTLHSKTNFARD